MEEDKDIKILEEYLDKQDRKFVSEHRLMILQAVDNLIARYKELEEKNKTLETLLQGNLYQMYLYYKELAGRYQANSISKDKVKEKIEELRNEEYDDITFKYNKIEVNGIIEVVLQELLEES